MVKIRYQAAENVDAAAIATVHLASWRDAYRSILDPTFLAGPIEEDRHALWSERLSNPPPNLLVEIARGSNRRLVGFIAAYRDFDVRWGSLVDNLHVLPELRGRKIGEHLLRSTARQLVTQGSCGGLHLWVFEENHNGLRFYQRLGGRVVERDTSRIPAASGKPILRISWPSLATLVGR
ncbi:GNAT family N-acetyltransferase [Methylobacterium goesingense]|nr:GNAT family N-acetyltransferase [Methylobacterium goesingense]